MTLFKFPLAVNDRIQVFPPGGTEGQVLTKVSDSDFDVAWSDAEAKRLTIVRKATHSISALRILKFDSSTHVSYATSDVDFGNAQAIGMSITAGNIGDDIEILLFGALLDGSFAYPLNEEIYLTISGQISTTPPSSGFLVKVGSSMGAGSIFLSPERPISL